MKYRRLTEIELNRLEQRFIQFLVANTITGSDWEVIKKEKPEQADKLIDIFSEMMFESSLKRIEFLKFTESKDIKIFHCKADSIKLIGLVANDSTPIDFTQPFDTQVIMQYTEGLSIYSQEKGYKDNREQELFKMIENGCMITDGKLFNILEKLYQTDK